MPKLGINTVIADGHPCVLVNSEIHPSNGLHLRMHFLNGEIHPANRVHLHLHFLNGEI